MSRGLASADVFSRQILSYIPSSVAGASDFYAAHTSAVAGHGPKSRVNGRILRSSPPAVVAPSLPAVAITSSADAPVVTSADPVVPPVILAAESPVVPAVRPVRVIKANPMPVRG